MSRVVHFTHHLCILADRGATWRDRIGRDSGSELNEYERRFGTRTRSPDTEGTLHCGVSVRKNAASPYTIDPARVTCRRCRDGCAENTRASWLARRASDDDLRPAPTWESDATLTLRAWYICCRHAGCAAPVGVDGAALVREWDAIERAARLRKRFTILSTIFLPAAEQRDRLGRIVGVLDAEELELARPAIDELNMAIEILAEVDRMRENAERRIAEVCKSIVDEAKRPVAIARAA